MKNIIAFTCCAAVIVLCGYSPSRAGDFDSGKEQVMKKIRNGALVVDVRTPEEYASGHYPGAVNIPLAEIEARLAEFGDVKRPIVVYCRSGNRSARARAILEAHGFRDVTNGGGLRDMPDVPR